jgi:hypothetical protein
MMRVLERLQGKGVAVSSSGKRVAVEYWLEVVQEEIKAGSKVGDSVIPGKRSIRGRVLPIVSMEEVLTLETSDGRKLEFIYTDGRGSIRGRELLA